MKTKYLLIGTWAVLFGGMIKAQPTITSSDIITGTFQFATVSFDQGVYTPGNGGANVNWDFSNVQGTTGSVRFLHAECNASIPECADFPTANRYIVDLDDNGNQSNDKNLYRLTGSQFEAIGARNIATNFTLTYADTPVLLKFPTTYLQSFTDTSSFTDAGSGTTTTTNDVITADGYGTIKTPEGTYTNVLRVKKESTINISMPGIPASVSQLTTYIWYKNNMEQIATFGVINLISPVSQPGAPFFQYISDSSVLATGEANAKKPAMVYPNPVRNGKVWIDTPDKIKLITIYDMTGKKVLTPSDSRMTPAGGKYAVDLQGIPDGNYIMKVETDKEIISNTLQVFHE